MADESLTFRAFGQDVSAGRMFGDLGDKADDAGDSIHGLGDESKDLDVRLAETRVHVRELIKEFESTGDVSLFKDFGKDRRHISILEAMRKELRGIGDDGESAVAQISKNFDRSIGDSIRGLPAELKGVAIVAGIGIAGIMAPEIGAVIGAAVLGGVGLGGVVGGVVLAAQDSRVKEAGAALGQNLFADLKSAADPFIEPLLRSFGELEETGASFAATLHTGFSGLAGTIGPLVRGIDGLVDNLGPGLEKAFSAAAPVVRALANELPEIGAAIGDMLASIAEEGDGATAGLIELLHVTEWLIITTGEFVGGLSAAFEWLVRTGDEFTTFELKALHAFDFVKAIPGVGQTFGWFEGLVADLNDETGSLIDEMGKAKDGTGDWDTELRKLLDTTDAETKALRDFASQMQDEFDPISNLLHRTQDLKAAQQDLSEAIKDHGRHSDQAKAAELRLATAILASDAAATNAAGTFDGHFSPALRATLKAGGATDAVIRDLERSARSLTKQLNTLEGVYNIQVRTEFISYRHDEVASSGHRVAGGPVEGSRSYWVGEHGPEIVTMGANGYVHDAASSRAMMSGASGGSGTVDVNVTLDVRGARDLFGQAIVEMLRVNPGFRADVAGYVAAA